MTTACSRKTGFFYDQVCLRLCKRAGQNETFPNTIENISVSYQDSRSSITLAGKEEFVVHKMDAMDGCRHLQEYKEEEGVETYKKLHAWYELID